MTSDPFSGLSLACVNTFGKTVTFAPAVGDSRNIKVIVTFPNPDGQRDNSQIVDLYADSSQFPDGVGNFDRFVIDGVSYQSYQHRKDEIGGLWINCRK